MARAAGADLILTLGGGSATDAAKMVCLCLANDVADLIGSLGLPRTLREVGVKPE